MCPPINLEIKQANKKNKKASQNDEANPPSPFTVGSYDFIFTKHYALASSISFSPLNHILCRRGKMNGAKTEIIKDSATKNFELSDRKCP